MGGREAPEGETNERRRKKDGDEKRGRVRKIEKQRRKLNERVAKKMLTRRERMRKIEKQRRKLNERGEKEEKAETREIKLKETQSKEGQRKRGDSE